ncbi:hypothetical protein SNE40_010750 [Patella caerulea]|uniref:Integrase catalytic domain-containing protein n=1 Tax=Patella caerulea TaxID=87958 RepID=A0AAN8K2K5_PATCE
MSAQVINTIIGSYGIHNDKAVRTPVTCFMNRVQRKATSSRNPQEDADNPAWVEFLAARETAVPDLLEKPGTFTTLQYSQSVSISEDEWCKLQDADNNIHIVKNLISSKSKPSKEQISNADRELKVLYRELDKFKLINDVLYRLITDEKGLSWKQLVVPTSHREEALSGVHEGLCHSGSQSTLRLARQRFFWPYMSSAVEEKCKQCERCILRKSPGQKAEMESISTSYPLQLVCIDFLSIEPDNKGIKDVLVITDHFTKYALAIPTKNQTAKTVAEALWENLISHYGWPERLHSDQGKDFESKVISELCRIGNVKKSRTTSYHPQGNPVERYNRTLLSMLGTLHHSQKLEWRKHVKPLTHAYNCTVNETTGYSPYYLMFGRHARLPIDIAFGTDPGMCQSSKPVSKYVSDLKDRLKSAYETALNHTLKSCEKNKKLYDRKAFAVKLEIGDRVLVRNVNIRGKHKLADKWEPDVYVVQSKSPDVPVYTVCNENNTGKNRTLHRNLLLPCGELSLGIQPVKLPKPRKIKTRSSTSVKTDSDTSESDLDLDRQDLDIDFGKTPDIVIQMPNKSVPIDSSLSAAAPEFVPKSHPNLSFCDQHEDIPQNDEIDNEELCNDMDINNVNESSVVLDFKISDDGSVVDDSIQEVTSYSSDNHHTESTNDMDINLACRKSSRTRNAPTRLTFDYLGEPSYQVMDNRTVNDEPTAISNTVSSMFMWVSTIFTSGNSPRESEIIVV